MARHKLISDLNVLEATLHLFARDGDRAVTFGQVGKATGLAPATLVQRFVTRDAMFAGAIIQGWVQAHEVLLRCEVALPANGHNAVAFLKSLGEALQTTPLSALMVASLPDHVLRSRASAWRQAVEASLQDRIDAGPGQVSEAAAAIFAAWQGRMMWQGTEGGDFRLRAILKKKQI